MAEIDFAEIPSLEEIAAALANEIPRRWGIFSIPGLSLAVEPTTQMIWLYSKLEKPIEPLPNLPLSIQIEEKIIEGDRFLAIGSRASAVRTEFYSFLVTLLKRIVVNGHDALTELKSEIAAWRDLLRMPEIMSNAAQIGLFGELWFLAWLLQSQGPRGLDAWLGPRGEIHDFKLANVDVEVKATLEHSRIHSISSASQLEPSKDRQLYLLSIQLQPAGQAFGLTLPHAIARIKLQLSGDTARIELFESQIATLGYDPLHHQSYQVTYRMRSAPTIIAIDSEFPRMTPRDVITAIGESKATRIKSLQYRLSVDGLGVPLASAEGQKIIPGKMGDPFYDK